MHLQYFEAHHQLSKHMKQVLQLVPMLSKDEVVESLLCVPCR